MMPLVLPDEKIRREICKSLGEDTARTEKQVEAFKEWLKCEPHLPKDVDEKVIRNFVRLCKCDLEKSKKKFEKFLAARIKFRNYYLNRNYDAKFFDEYSIHRQVVNYTELTSDGYRIGYFRFPKNPDDFNFEHILHYGLLQLDFLLHKDEGAGTIIVYDLDNFTPQHLSRLNIKCLIDILDLMYNISPTRIKDLHLLNVPPIADAVIKITQKVLTEKLQKRMKVHKSTDSLLKCIPKHLLPHEYGGDGMSLDELGDNYKKYFIENENWIKETENLKLVGPIPPEKRNIYSFEETAMEGTFRQLSID